MDGEIEAKLRKSFFLFRVTAMQNVSPKNSDGIKTNEQTDLNKNLIHSVNSSMEKSNSISIQ